MKKFFFLIAVMVMTTAALAQQPLKISVLPAQGETLERARIAPTTYTAIYFGKDMKDAKSTPTRYYLIIRPVESSDYKTFKLFYGPADNMIEVPHASFVNDDGRLTTRSAIGRLTFSRFSDQGSLVSQKDSILLQKLPRE